MAKRSNHDPAVMQILKNKGYSSYGEWADEVLWKIFHEAISNGNSPERSMILKSAEDKLKGEAIESLLKQGGSSNSSMQNNE